MHTIQQQNSPLKSLLLLLILTFAISIGFQAGLLGIYSVLSEDVAPLSLEISEIVGSKLLILKLFLLVSSVVTFLLPSLVLQRIENRYLYFPYSGWKDYKMYVLILSFLISFVPVMSKVGEWNMQMRLPESLAELESWMQLKENQMSRQISVIAMDGSWSGLLMNTVVLAIVPAVCEEYFFRGSLQGIFFRWFSNAHVAIWLVAFIFSAIHVQFYGFFPRMILGVFFGYMLVWSGNIALPIFAHFVNNFSITLLAFWYTRQGKTYEDLQSIDSYSIFLYLGSMIASGFIVWLFYIYSGKYRLLYGKGLAQNKNL